MARFVPLKFRSGGIFAARLGLVTCLGTALYAQAPMTPMTPVAPASTPALAKAPATNTAAVKPPLTNAAPIIPPALQDTMGKYGKILTVGDEMAHPLKLKMPFPGVGEVKVPKVDELVMRDKLEQLAKLSDDDIRKQLAQWPAFAKMNLRDEGAMLSRIQDFRDYRSRAAMQKAHDMGLLTLTPEQKTKFEMEFWDKRLQMDQELDKQFLPIFAAREQKLEDELFREFSSGTPGPVAQQPKPATPPPVKKPAPPAPAPLPAAKTTAATTVPAMSEPPMAQAPR